ncbi:MAG: hypothetical protein RIC55_30945 [Pirellulaceae bacterium]
MSPNSENLNWLAFRYIASEMSAEEQQQFEVRLADDQSVREAVEEAVALHEAVCLAGREAPLAGCEAALVQRGVPHPAWVMAVAASVLVVVALAWLVTQRSDSGDPQAGGDPPRGEQPAVPERGVRTDSLALTWAALRTEQASADSLVRSSEDWNDDAGIAAKSDNDGVKEEGELPAWLLTAVSANRAPVEKP